MSKKSLKTPFGRLLAGIAIGEVGLAIALMTPLAILLTLKFYELNPETAMTAFGTTTGIGALFAIFANPIGGVISDHTTLKFGRRRTWILLGSILASCCLVGIGLSTNYIIIVMLWCLTQIFFNFVLASFTALIPDQVDESRRGSMSGILGFIIPLSPVLGLVLMTILSNVPTSLKWIVLAVISVVTAGISCLLIQEGKAEYIAESRGKPSFAEALSRIFPSPRKYPSFTWGWLVKFFMYMAFCSSSYNSMMFIVRYHYSSAQATQTTTVLTIIGMIFLAISSIFGGMLSDKLRKQKPFMFISAAIIVAALAIMAAAPTITYIFIGAALANFGGGIFSAVDMALVARILPSKNDAAKDFGIMNVANTVPQSLVPLVAPGLVSIGGWPFYFGALAICGAISGLTAIPIPEMSPKSEAE